jgi:hypothetical protein
MSRIFGSLNNLEVRGPVQICNGIAVTCQFSAVSTEYSLTKDFYSAFLGFTLFTGHAGS